MKVVYFVKELNENSWATYAIDSTAHMLNKQAISMFVPRSTYLTYRCNSEQVYKQMFFTQKDVGSSALKRSSEQTEFRKRLS